MLYVLWVASAVVVISFAVRTGRHPEAVLGGRLGTSFLFLVSGAAVNTGMLVRGDDYGQFADSAYLGFVRDTWRDLVVPNHHGFITLLTAFELAVGALVLLGGRGTQLAYLAAIGFHVGLLSFGWGFYGWSLPMIAAFVTLLRAERRVPSPRRTRAPGSWYGGWLVALGLLLTTIALLGPLLAQAIRYHYSETMVNQAIGLDAFALAVVAPLSLVAGVLALRGSRLAPYLGLGPAAFAVYMTSQYVIGPEYLARPGNSERFFPLFLATLVSAGVALVGCWQATTAVRTTERQQRRRGALLLGIAAFVVAGMYLANGFLGALTDFPRYVAERAATSEYDEHPTAYWLVATLDLGLVVPVTVAVGLALRRRREWASRAFYGVLGWFALVPGSVAAMALTMVARDDPAASTARAMLFTAVAVVLTALAVLPFTHLSRDLPGESLARGRAAAQEAVGRGSTPGVVDEGVGVGDALPWAGDGVADGVGETVRTADRVGVGVGGEVVSTGRGECEARGVAAGVGTTVGAGRTSR
jgi:hypothetical protein